MPRLSPSRLAATAATAATLAVAPAPAHAADWSPSQPIRYGGPSALPGLPIATLNDDGFGVAVANTGGSGVPGPHADAAAFTNGVFLDPKPFTTGTTRIDAVHDYARTGLMSAGLHAFSSRSQVVLAFGSLSANRATLGTVHPVGPSTLHAADPVLAVNAKGDAAMVFAVCRDGGCAHSLIYLATRRAGSSRVTTTRIATATRTLPRVATAINERGDAVAVWTDNDDVLARVRTLGGTLRAAQRAGGTRRGSLAAPSAALSLHRGVLVGWATPTVSEGDASSGTVNVAQARDGGPFTRSLLETLPPTSDTVADAAIRVAFDPSGRRRLAWTGAGTVRSALLHGAANGHTAAAVVDRRDVAPGVLDDQELRGEEELLAIRSGAGGTVSAADRTGAGAFTVTAVGDHADAADAVLGADRALVVFGSSGGARYAQRVLAP